MYDEIWLVVRNDNVPMHKTSYNGREIRAYKTESKAKTQAKIWNKPYKVVDKPGYYDKITSSWHTGTYKMVDPGELYKVVKYVPAS